MKDLVGQRFGDANVKEYVGSHPKGEGSVWKLQCKCGKEYTATTKQLNRGERQHNCGCGNQRERRDLTGRKFGRGTVIGLHCIDKRRLTSYRVWKLECVCGNTYTARTSQLTSGHTRSCGCLHGQDRSYEDIPTKFMSKYLSSSKKRHLKFELEAKDVWNKYVAQDKKCALSGVDISFDGNVTASIDRINSSLGYVVGNIQIVHKQVNLMKHVMDNNELLEWCRLILDYSSS